MKKIALVFLLIVIIIAGMSYLYLNYKINLNTAKTENKFFQSYYEKEIKGSELATIMNKAVDNNTKNDIQKDPKGKYINNDNNSINIDIKMLDIDKIYDMETLYAGGIAKFAQYYGDITFKCTRNRISQIYK